MDTACCRRVEGELANAKTFFVGRHSEHEKLDTVVGFPLEFEHGVKSKGEKVSLLCQKTTPLQVKVL